jgi:SAM-dependent methyltransferase
MEGIAPGMFGRDVRPLIHHVLRRRGGAAESLARLFAYGDALGESLLKDLLGEHLVASLLASGLLLRDEARDGAIACPFELRPFENLFLLADDPTGGRDAVMPPAGTTHHLARLMPAHPTGRVLDVGCGPGSLALTAASRSANEVLGTDVNPRAIALANFSARLNGIQAQFELGDLTAPARGSRWDLVVSQPPFVIQPPDASAITFLHGGPSGEELALRLLAEIPDVLAPGGRALMLMEAVARPDEPLHSRMRPALGDAPVDLLVLAAPGAPPAMQVIAYATLEVPDGGPAYPVAAQKYLDQLDRLHVAEFQLALVVLRAAPVDRTGWRRLAATVPVASIARGDTNALERLLAGVDLAALDDTRLRQRSVSPARHARWVDERPQPDPASSSSRFVRFGAGSFGSDLAISDERFAMAASLHHAPTISAAIEAYAGADHEPAENVERALLGFVREGLMRGLFEPRPD